MLQNYIKPERIYLKEHPELSEVWVHNIIADDPSILGLGDLILRDRERPQPKAGRLDLLLQDPEEPRRYEVEIQLGRTDESHIIRTIEYWDIERKRYPQYDHCAVIIAEDITSRFLNVISLFNSSIPLIAIQMQALKFGNNITLVFTTVLNEISRGLEDEDEESKIQTDRNYWEQRGTKATVLMADELLEIAKQFDANLQLKYNKFYIGLAKNGQPNNFVIFRPKKKMTHFEVKIPQSREIEEKIEASGIDSLGYDKRWGGQYRIRLMKDDIKKHKEFIEYLTKIAYEYRNQE